MFLISRVRVLFIALASLEQDTLPSLLCPSDGTLSCRSRVQRLGVHVKEPRTLIVKTLDGASGSKSNHPCIHWFTHAWRASDRKYITSVIQSWRNWVICFYLCHFKELLVIKNAFHYPSCPLFFSPTRNPLSSGPTASSPPCVV